jgi:hypothetical protein
MKNNFYQDFLKSSFNLLIINVNCWFDVYKRL